MWRLMSVGKWILETTRLHKHVQIPEELFFATFLYGIIQYFKLYN